MAELVIGRKLICKNENVFFEILNFIHVYIWNNTLIGDFEGEILDNSAEYGYYIIVK